MVPTDAGLRMIEPSASILRAAEVLFSDARGFDPPPPPTPSASPPATTSTRLFLPQLVAQIKAQAPRCRIEIHPLSADSDYHAQLAQGEADVVIGNWLRRPTTCTWARLFGDEVVCLVAKTTRPCAAAGTRRRLAGGRAHRAHAHHPGAKGVIDEHLDTQGLVRNITARCPHFGLMPGHGGIELAGADHRPPVLRAFCERLPVQILPSPVAFPRMMYYQLWHERTHASAAGNGCASGSSRWRHAAQGIAAETHDEP
jgi:DNA-binding transcriptional LysR family regulator